ncbi:MAG TPA: hypothetical protein VGC17_05690, partial [Lactovum miscens]|uniref:hypothetical protein n=1 Tax=Lactovum miscens TaxID=190387 RepID=UPI002ED87F38
LNKLSFFEFLSAAILPIAYKYKDWLIALHTTSIDTSWTYALELKYQSHIAPYLGDYNKKFGLSKEFVTRLIIRNVNVVVSAWITSESPDLPKIFKKKFIRLMYVSSNKFLAEEWQEDLQNKN